MPQPARKSLPLWPWVVLAVGLGAAALAYIVTPQPASKVRNEAGALIGGPFQLVDQSGKTYTAANLRGHYSVIYFGYTFCPDVCPTELQTVAQALDLLSPQELARVQPIFVTVDPDRDTPPVIAKYVKLFHPKLIGLTGTDQQVAAIEKAYRIYAAKAPGGSAQNYLVNHSSFIYVMGPDGEYVTHFGYGVTPGKIADTLKQLVGS